MWDRKRKHTESDGDEIMREAQSKRLTTVWVKESESVIKGWNLITILSLFKMWHFPARQYPSYRFSLCLVLSAACLTNLLIVYQHFGKANSVICFFTFYECTRSSVIFPALHFISIRLWSARDILFLNLYSFVSLWHFLQKIANVYSWLHVLFIRFLILLSW